MAKYTTITDVVEQVVEASLPLGKYADDFDSYEIAREITEYRDGGFVVIVDEDEFWKTVYEHQL